MRWLFLMASLSACESWEGDRVAIPGASASLLIPNNWEYAKSAGAAVIEAAALPEKAVHLRVLVTENKGLTLDALASQTLAAEQALERDHQLRIVSVTETPIERGALRGLRIVHQIELGQSKIEATQIADHLFRPGVGIVALVVGPRLKVEAMGGDVDRVLASIRDDRPPPATPSFPDQPGFVPPDMVSSASQSATRRLFDADIR